MRPLIIVACAAALPRSGVCQQPTATPAAESRGGRQVVSRVPVDMLTQLSGSLRQLANKVSPAVVQIEVTGFGAAEEGGHKDTALIVRQHGIGSGVIVDPNGYIMTNAHVVAGAQRIRVVLWLPPATFDDVSSSGDVQVLNDENNRVAKADRPGIAEGRGQQFTHSAFPAGSLAAAGRTRLRNRQPGRSAELCIDGRDQLDLATTRS